jgi:hypothetical protein
MFRHFHLYLLGMLAVMLLVLAAAIGLLKRRNWARKIFMVIFVAAVVSLFGWIIKKLASPAVRSEFAGISG